MTTLDTPIVQAVTSIGTDEYGWVTRTAKQRLSHKEAVDEAIALVQAVQDSIFRNQGRTSEAILARQEHPTGRALAALRAIYGP